MFSIQKRLLIGAVLLAMVAGCDSAPSGQQTANPSGQQSTQKHPDPIIADALQKRLLGDWLHDIDAADRFEDYLIKNVSPAEITSEIQDAAGLASTARRIAGSTGCWPRDGNGWPHVTTATTDHACLDAAGYKRSR